MVESVGPGIWGLGRQGWPIEFDEQAVPRGPCKKPFDFPGLGWEP